MQNLLAETCTLMQDVLEKSLKWSKKKDSIWVTKKALFKMAGGAYKKKMGAAGEPLFWRHLRVLHVGKYLPKFTSKNTNGNPICFNAANKGFSDVWCKKCAKSTKVESEKCKDCFMAVRFSKLKPGQTLLSKVPQIAQFHEVLSRTNSSSTDEGIPRQYSTFKGEEFTKYLLPRALGLKVSDNCMIPRIYSAILEQENLTPLFKIKQLLCSIYDVAKPVQPKVAPSVNKDTGVVYVKDALQPTLKTSVHEMVDDEPEASDAGSRMWIAPAKKCNAQIGLGKKVKLTNKNSVGVPVGFFHVWGFNCADVYKWHSLQSGDFVLFGNTRDGFCRMGTVKAKFVWKSDEASQIFEFVNGEKPWLYGFTLDMITVIKFELTGSQLRDIIGCSYQTQSRLDLVKGQQVVDAIVHSGSSH